MAHRLPVAGVPTELSEHFAFFRVHDKPKSKVICEVEVDNQCCLRPKFLCISQSVMENSCEHKRPRHHPCPFVVKCCCCGPQEAIPVCCAPVCEHVAEECQCNVQKRILKRHKSESCIARKQLTARNIRCDAFPPNGACEHDKIRIIEITRPIPRHNDDHILEMKMREKLCRLERDMQEFDLALKCMENRKRKPEASEQCCVGESYKITCCPKDPCALETCKITCCCNDPVPRKWRCYPVASRKHQCTKPFYGRRKSPFNKGWNIRQQASASRYAS